MSSASSLPSDRALHAPLWFMLLPHQHYWCWLFRCYNWPLTLTQGCSWWMLLGRWQQQCNRGGCAPNGAASRNAPWGQSASSPTHTQPVVHIVMCSMSLHCSKCMVLSEQETRGQPHSHAGHTYLHAVQKNKDSLHDMRYHVSDIGTKRRSKICLFTSQP